MKTQLEVKNRLLNKWILLIFLFPQILIAQNIEISGFVRDSTSKIMLKNCIVYAKNSNDSIIGAILTTTKGGFKLKIPYLSRSYILIKFFGYNEKVVKIPYDLQTKSIILDIIDLVPESIELGNVDVIGKQKIIDKNFDKTVYTIPSVQKEGAKTIFEILKTMPGVVVDEQRNIRYKGTTAIITVDNIPAEYLYPQLDIISIDDIKNIELTDLSTRTGSGKGGIINIKLKSKKEGINGMMEVNARTINLKNLDEFGSYLNLNYKINNLILFTDLIYASSLNYYNSNTSGSLHYSNNDYQTSNTIAKTLNLKNYLNYDGFVYQVLPNAQLTAMYFYNRQDFSEKKNFNSIKNIATTPFDQYSKLNNSDSKDKNHALSLFYNQNFDSLGKSLDCGLQLQNNGNNKLNNQHYDFKYLNGGTSDSTLLNYQKDKVDQKALFFRLFYNHPVNKKIRWNLNYNNITFISNSSSVFYEKELEIKSLNKVYDGIVQNHDCSFRLATRIKKLKFDAGLAAKYQNINSELTRYPNEQDTLINVDIDNYNLLPSFTINYNCDSISEIKFTYDKSASYYDDVINLTNYLEKQDPRNWTTGNPNIKPVIINNFYLGYILSKETMNLAVDLFYSYTNNEIEDLTYYYSPTILITSPENIAKKRVLGIDFSTWVMPSPKLNINFSASIFHTTYDISKLNKISASLNLDENNRIKKEYGYIINGSVNYNLSETSTILFDIYYKSKEITFNGYNKDWLNSSISIAKYLFNNKFIASIGVVNLLDELVQRGSSEKYMGVNQSTNYNGSDYKRMYTISLKYIIGAGDRGTIQ